MSRIFIVGAGLVGTTSGRALVGAGHRVTFVDTDRGRVDELSREGLDARTTLSLVGEPESMIVLSLPTPGVGHGYDLSALRRGAQDVGRALVDADAPHVVVVRSTVPPGTTDGMVRHVLERISGKRAGHGFALAHHPEFLRSDHAEDDVRWPVLTVVGASDRRVAEQVVATLAPFGGEQVVVGSAATAELVKIVHTVRHATEVRFWSEVRQVGNRLGIDVDEVSAALGGDAPHRGTVGEYLVKDAEGFLGFAADLGLPLPLLAAVVADGVFDRRLAAQLVAGPRRSQENPERENPQQAEKPGEDRVITLDTRTVVASNGRI